MAGEELNKLLGDAPSDVRQALSHPYRRQVLRILLANGPMSSTEIAGHPSAPCRALCLARHIRLLGESSLLFEERVTKKWGMAQRFFSAVPLPSWIRQVLAETEELDRGTGLRVTAEERAALEAHIPEVSGVWAAVRFELGGPAPPLTFDEGIRLAMALAGPIRQDGTVAVQMPSPELRSMLARVREALATHRGIDERRARQIESVCVRMFGTKDLPQGMAADSDSPPGQRPWARPGRDA